MNDRKVLAQRLSTIKITSEDKLLKRKKQDKDKILKYIE